MARPELPRAAGALALREDPAALSDSEVVARVRAGDTALFELLMRRHNRRLFRTLRAILKSDGEAEDALQECYVRAYRQLHTFEDRARVSTWLTRIGVNLALDRLRRQARVVSLDPEAFAAELDRSGERAPVNPEDANVSRELAGLLERAIDALPLAYRSVFVMREIEGLGTRDTAESLGIEEATVKTRLHRARGRLRETLYEHAGSTAPDVFRFGGARCDRVVAGVLERLAV